MWSRVPVMTLDGGESGGKRALPNDAVLLSMRVFVHFASCGRRLGSRALRIRISTLPNFAVASGNEEDLPGTEASPFDGGATFLPQLVGRVSKVARNGSSNHETSPFKSG